MMITKHAHCRITNVARLTIDRNHRENERFAEEGWRGCGGHTHGYIIDRISPASIQRLARVLGTVQWVSHETESWYESGYGYDFSEHHHFEFYPGVETDENQYLAIWLLQLALDEVNDENN